MVTCLFTLIHGVSRLLLFYCLTYKRTDVSQDYSRLNNSFNYEPREALNQTALQIVTSAVYSIPMKSIFARAVIGSSGVVTHSINTTVVCSVGTLIDI